MKEWVAKEKKREGGVNWEGTGESDGKQGREKRRRQRKKKCAEEKGRVSRNSEKERKEVRDWKGRGKESERRGRRRTRRKIGVGASMGQTSEKWIEVKRTRQDMIEQDDFR